MRKTRLLLFFSDFIVQCKLTFNSFLSSTKLSPTIVLRGPKHLWMWILWVIGGKLKQKPIYVTISCSWGYFMRLHMIYLIPSEILQGRMDAIKIEITESGIDFSFPCFVWMNQVSQNRSWANFRIFSIYSFGIISFSQQFI